MRASMRAAIASRLSGATGPDLTGGSLGVTVSYSGPRPSGMASRRRLLGPTWLPAAVLAAGLALVVAPALAIAGHRPEPGRSRPPASAPAQPSRPTRPRGSGDAPQPPARFAPGACRRFGPTGGGRGRAGAGAGRGPTVFVDPGHGGLDTGAIGSGPAATPVEEKGVDLAIGLHLLAILRSDGDTVVMSRVSDTLVGRMGPGDTVGTTLLSPAGLEADLRARVACADGSGAGVLVGVHLNAFADPSVGGAETVYGAGRSFTPLSQALAELVQQDVVDGLAGAGWAVASRGVVSDAGQGAAGLTPQARAYGHLLELGPARPGYFSDPTPMPGAIAEPLFVTNPAEAAVAADPRGAVVVARSLALAVQTWIAEHPAPPRR